VETYYKALVRFIYGFQRTHFDLLQLLVQLDGDEARYQQEVPSPEQFLALAAEAARMLQALPLSRSERGTCDALVRELNMLGGLNQRLVLADFKAPQDDVARAREACNKAQHLLRQCRQIVAERASLSR